MDNWQIRLHHQLHAALWREKGAERAIAEENVPFLYILRVLYIPHGLFRC
jgi:hypothetical protein